MLLHTLDIQLLLLLLNLYFHMLQQWPIVQNGIKVSSLWANNKHEKPLDNLKAGGGGIQGSFLEDFRNHLPLCSAYLHMLWIILHVVNSKQYHPSVLCSLMLYFSRYSVENLPRLFFLKLSCISFVAFLLLHFFCTCLETWTILRDAVISWNTQMETLGIYNFL